MSWRRERQLLAGLCILLALLQVFDWHSTLRAAGSGRGEINPLILGLAACIGFTAAVTAAKSAALVLIAAYYLVVSRFGRALWPSVSLVAVCVAYAAVVLNNYS